MTRLPVLHPLPNICQRGGACCASYVDDGSGDCRHFLQRADTAEPACVLGLVEVNGDMTETEVGAAIGVTKQGVAHIVFRAGEKLRAPNAEPAADEPEPLTDAAVIMLDAIRRGASMTAVVAAMSGYAPRYAENVLGKLARRGVVSRIRRGVWRLVQCADRGAA